MRVFKNLLGLLALALNLPAQAANFRIALRLDSGQIAIVGDELQSPNEPQLTRFPKAAGHADLLPGESIYLPPPQYLPAASWGAGDRWQLYTANAPLPLRIDKLGLTTYCGGIGGYQVAIARADRPIEGDIFLASPNRISVATAALVPLTAVPTDPASSKIAALLAHQARALVKTDAWTLHPGQSPDFADRVRRANRGVLSGTLPQLRVQRWAPPGGDPLLFVEAVWLAPDGTPLFACDAVFAQGPPVATLLAFSARKAEYMRMEEFADRDWRLTAPSAFLGAWQVGARRYILQYGSGLEAFSVNLMELLPLKGLVPTGVGFSAGC